MKTYRIDVVRTDYLHCYVEADSADDAEVLYASGDCELKWDDSETGDFTVSLVGGDSTESDDSV